MTMKPTYEQVNQAKETLRAAGYMVEGLWTLPDVMDNYDCDEDTAMDILESACSSDGVMQSMWYAIEIIAEMNGVERKDPDDENSYD